VLVIITDIQILDPIIIALNILLTGYKLIRKSIAGLMNEVKLEMLNQLSAKLISI
jgi:divalent metal cation (Fe/Co/Zn/Cd) transporter